MKDVDGGGERPGSGDDSLRQGLGDCSLRQGSEDCILRRGPERRAPCDSRSGSRACVHHSAPLLAGSKAAPCAWKWKICSASRSSAVSGAAAAETKKVLPASAAPHSVRPKRQRVHVQCVCSGYESWPPVWMARVWRGAGQASPALYSPPPSPVSRAVNAVVQSATRCAWWRWPTLVSAAAVATVPELLQVSLFLLRLRQSVT